MYGEDGLDPKMVLELDRMAMTSLKTQDMPSNIRDKITRLLRDFGHKKDLERYGKYLRQKTRARTSSETPQTLSSRFLPEFEEGEDPFEKLRKKPEFRDLFDHVDPQTLNTAEISRLAQAKTDQWRHKLFQMSWAPETALTYMAHRYPGTYASCHRVLYELKTRAPYFNPRSVLDYGAGPAPGLAAAAHVFDSVETMLGIEPSDHMMQIGKFLTADLNPEIEWQHCLYELSHEKYDLAIASYVQMEIRGQESRDALVKQLWNRLKPGGVLLLIEQGTPTGFRFMHHTRELFLERIGRGNFHFVAPCPHEGMCPMALTGRDWCHFAQRTKRTPHRAYNKGSRKRFLEEEKFSFLCIRKSAGPRDRYSSEAEALTASEKSYFWPRIVMPALKASKHTLIDVCSAPQNFERISTSKSKAHTFGYRWSRKAMWGDLWRFPKRVVRPEARNYIPEETKAHLDRLAKRAWEALRGESEEAESKEHKAFKEREEQFYGH